MRNTGALGRRVVAKRVGKQASRLIPLVSFGIGATAIGVDSYKFFGTQEIGLPEYSYGTVANGLSMWPGPVVSGVGLLMNLGRGPLFGE